MTISFLPRLIEDVKRRFKHAGGVVGNLHRHQKESIPIAKQTETLISFFPDLDSVDPNFLSRIKRSEIILPPEACGWFAIPRWPMLASTRKEAVQKVIELINKTQCGAFNNQLEADRLSLKPRTEIFLEDIRKRQNNSHIFIIPAQLGYQHKEISTSLAEKKMANWEFSLDVFTVCCILLVNPTIIQQYQGLCIYCAGDEFSPKDDGNFSDIPNLNFKKGRVFLTSNPTTHRRWNGGTASGFLYPQ